jgi:hypothetical protein
MVEIKILLSIKRLRSVLGLPDYPLLRRMGGLTNEPVNLPEVISNPGQEDVDHIDTQINKFIE